MSEGWVHVRGGETVCRVGVSEGWESDNSDSSAPLVGPACKEISSRPLDE